MRRRLSATASPLCRRVFQSTGTGEEESTTLGISRQRRASSACAGVTSGAWSAVGQCELVASHNHGRTAPPARSHTDSGTARRGSGPNPLASPDGAEYLAPRPPRERVLLVRYTVSIDIALPRATVLELATDPAHLPSWVRGLVLHEPMHGRPGEVGTASRIVLETGRQRVTCVETITRREPADLSTLTPDVVVRYEREIVTDGMWTAVRDRLTEIGPTSTRWESENEVRFGGGPMRFVGPLLRPTFRRQSRQAMRDFQAFAERGVDVRAT